MDNYLKKTFDWNNEDLVSQYDELPLWSSPFGLMLLDNVPLRKYSTYIDIGCGTGFPLIDISQKIGSGCHCVGIDPWERALGRVKAKIKAIGLTNVDVVHGSAEKIPFPDMHFELMTSNLGINNFDNVNSVLTECHRVIKPDAPFCLTTNIVGHFKEFFEIFMVTMSELNVGNKCKELFEHHVAHRGTAASHNESLCNAGFTIRKQITAAFCMRFLDGTSFLNHSVIASGFLPAWKQIVANEHPKQFFNRLEHNLNEYARSRGELVLSVPMVYFECCSA